MRFINIPLKNSKITMSHFAPYSSDLVEHDHGEKYSITIPVSGETVLDLNHKSNHLKKYSRMITIPGEKHLHFTRESESRILLINIKKSFLENVISSRLYLGTSEVDFSIYSEDSSEKLIKIADKIVRSSIFYDENSGRMEELEWELAETFLTIQEGSHSQQWKKEVIYSQYPMIKNIIEYIYENYQNNISLDDLSMVSNISKYYFLRSFKEVVGCTPNQFILNVRLEKAVQYLISTNLDITTICFKAGFGSLNNFERVFKKRFGCTISEYRKSHKKY